jgi:hypothetical protein
MSEIKEILEGFNAGYIIEQKQPELAKQLQAAVSEVEDEFFEGFVAGGEEASKERTRGKLLDKLRGDLSGSTRSRSKDLDKDGIDMDR